MSTMVKLNNCRNMGKDICFSIMEVNMLGNFVKEKLPVKELIMKMMLKLLREIGKMGFC